MGDYYIFGIVQSNFINFIDLKNQIKKICFKFYEELELKFDIITKENKDFSYQNNFFSFYLTDFKDLEDDIYEDLSENPVQFKKNLQFKFRISEAYEYEFEDNEKKKLCFEIFNFIFKNYMLNLT